VKEVAEKVVKKKLGVEGPKKPPCLKEYERLEKMDEKLAKDSVKPYSNRLEELWDKVINAL
jgi:hypothetical protein